MQKKNRYIMLRMRMLLLFIFGGKVTFRKIFNSLRCFLAYMLKSDRSASTPFLITVETWNECNERCVFCRTMQGSIYDTNPTTPVAEISKGKMPIETVTAIIDELKEDLLLAVLYTNGEPLIYKDIYTAIRHCTEKGVATMIASNGILLTEEISRKLMEAGLDFVKVHVSGFSQECHGVQHRVGNIAQIKQNLRSFVQVKKKYGYRTLLLLDYIIYRHNEHELEQMYAFCKELGVPLNVRAGFPRGMGDEDACYYKMDPHRVNEACDWPWKVLSINWDGTVFPCCEYTVYGGAPKMGVFRPGESSLRDLWNGKTLVALRRAHADHGRIMPVCNKCSRKGTAFRF